MSKGKRYDGEPKLNMKKVFAVIIAIIVVIMFIIAFKKLISSDETESEKQVTLEYLAVYTNDKWGVIDSYGNIVIEATYDEMIVIPDPEQDVFICTYNVDYEEGTYETKVINADNEEIITGYDNIEAIENYDSSNTLWYEEGVLKVEKDGLYGLVDLAGKELAACEYTEIVALTGTSNSLVTTKDGKKGIIDNTGAVILDNEYADIEAISEKYENGYIVKTEDGSYGVMNWNKTVAVEAKYEDVKQIYGDGDYYVVKEDGDWIVVDTVGGSYIEGEYDDITSINSGYAIVKSGKKYGVVDILDGEVVISVSYDSLEYAENGRYIFETDEKYGIVDRDDVELIEATYSSLVYRSDANFYEGENSDYTSDLIDTDLNVKLTGIISSINVSSGYMLVRVEDEYKYYNFKFEEKESQDVLKDNTLFLSKQDGKYGFIDANGIVVVDYIYDDATEQNEYGYASVKLNGLWGCIDSTGDLVIEPSYNLDNNSLVEFIGKWHIGVDLNLNYYTDM